MCVDFTAVVWSSVLGHRCAPCAGLSDTVNANIRFSTYDNHPPSWLRLPSTYVPRDHIRRRAATPRRQLPASTASGSNVALSVPRSRSWRGGVAVFGRSGSRPVIRRQRPGTSVTPSSPAEQQGHGAHGQSSCSRLIIVGGVFLTKRPRAAETNGNRARPTQVELGS